MVKQRPTRQQILELLSYDRESGTFTWKKVRGSRARPGQTAGSSAVGRERRLSINGQMFSNAQIVWFLETGVWPASSVRHLDGDPLNDRFDNLFLFGDPQNKVKHNVAKLENGQWLVSVRNRFVGLYSTEQEANLVLKGVLNALG